MLRFAGRRQKKLDLVRKQTTRYRVAQRGYYTSHKAARIRRSAFKRLIAPVLLNERAVHSELVEAHLLCRNFRFLAFVTALDKGVFHLAGLSWILSFSRSRRRHQVGAARTLAANQGAELIRRCRAGDGAAWEEIVQSYSRRIYNLAYRFTSRADAAEDLTQEVFVRVYRSLGQYDSKQGDLQNWLMRLARNLIMMTIEKVSGRHTTIMLMILRPSYHLHTTSRSVQQKSNAVNSARKFRQALISSHRICVPVSFCETLRS